MNMYRLKSYKLHRSWIGLIGALLMIAVAALMLVSSTFKATAQGDVHPQTSTPLPSPTNNGGSAQWTINSMTFQSNYPKGFEFALDATSSGGKIVESTVMWSHAPG